MSEEPLPTELDFDPAGGNLDAQCAWKNFGGLTLDEAKMRFAENPWGYQGDFMWMGVRAFAYYFPVLEDFVHTVAAGPPSGDDNVATLTSGIRFQFQHGERSLLAPLAPRVLALVKFVLANAGRFGFDAAERRDLIERWCRLARRVEAVQQ